MVFAMVFPMVFPIPSIAISHFPIVSYLPGKPARKKTSAAHLQEGTTIAELKFTVVLGTQQHCQLNSQKDGQTVENQEIFFGGNMSHPGYF